MNKADTTNSTLNMIKSVCAERDRKELDRLRANRVEMEKREEAERERVQQSSNLLNSYIKKAMAREEQLLLCDPYNIALIKSSLAFNKGNIYNWGHLMPRRN